MKDRYCLKHPGYEKLFFCKTTCKGLCEKCLPLHSDHDVVTVLLESQKLRKGLSKFKTDFAALNGDWEHMQKKYQNKKENFDYEVEKTCDQIDEHFKELIRKLQESKRKYIEAFKIRAKDEMKDFFTQYNNFSNFFANIKQKHEEIEDLEAIHQRSSNFDLVKESTMRQNDEIFMEFCPEYTQSLSEFEDKYKELETKSTYSFHFHTTTKDEEIISNVHKNIKIKMKIEDSVDNEESKDSVDPDVALSSSKPTKPKADTGSPYPSNFKQLYRLDKANKKMITYDFGSKKTSKTTYEEPTPDEHNNEEMLARSMSQIARGVLSPDSKSVCLDSGDIYVFGASETKYSDCMYTVDGTELEECQNLPVKRKKISCAASKEFIYFTGEFENINVNRATLERYDTENQVFEEIYGLNKQSN